MLTEKKREPLVATLCYQGASTNQNIAFGVRGVTPYSDFFSPSRFKIIKKTRRVTSATPSMTRVDRETPVMGWRLEWL
jgi:hypothetical protein